MTTVQTWESESGRTGRLRHRAPTLAMPFQPPSPAGPFGTPQSLWEIWCRCGARAQTDGFAAVGL